MLKTRPTPRPAIVACSSRIAAVKRQLNDVMPTRPARAAASLIDCASARVIASDCSHSTCAPPATARSAIARCRCGGVAITTISGRARSSMASQLAKTPGTL